MNIQRTANLFRNGRSQAVRIPKEFELPGRKVTFHKEGHRLVIEPEVRPSLKALLASWAALPEEDRMPEIEDYPPEPFNL